MTPPSAIVVWAETVDLIEELRDLAPITGSPCRFCEMRGAATHDPKCLILRAGVLACRVGAAGGPVRPVRTEAATTAADFAVRYVLDRAQTDADLGYLVGPMTEAFRRLCEAEAGRTGEPLAEVEARRGTSQAREPRRYLSQSEWRDQIERDRREAV